MSEIITPREIDIIRYMCLGCPNKEIAKRMKISTKTVESHFSNIYRKLRMSGAQIHNRIGLMHWAKCNHYI